MLLNQENIIYLWAHKRQIHGLTRYRRQGYDSLFPYYNSSHTLSKETPTHQAVIVPFRKK